MVENPPWLLEAVDKLIEKYSNPSKDEFVPLGIFACPLCMACGNDVAKDVREWCIGCPNNYFQRIGGGFYSLGCSGRIDVYPHLDYHDVDNYPNLVEFWTIFRDLIKHGKSSEEAMKIVIKDFSPLT